MMALQLCLYLTLLFTTSSVCLSQTQITIFPHIYSQNGRTAFETTRWNGHNGLDQQQYLQGNIAIGSQTGRWLNPDIDVYRNAKQDPNRPGYADPAYFQDPSLQQALAGMYLENMKTYGYNLSIVMETKSQFWPSWMNTSLHGGVFPNNLDAGAEMALLMVEAVYNFTGGIIPPYFEVINEPETLYANVDWDTIITFHKIVAQKLHFRFPNLKVCGPTKDGETSSLDEADFRIWGFVRDFMDMSLYNLDFFSFHPYNAFHSHNGNHSFDGINEARLTAVIDLIEAYAVKKTGRPVSLITSEYGLGGVDVDSQTTAATVQWAYCFLHNAHMFTYLNHRGVMEKAVAFLLSHDTYGFENGSLFYANASEKFVSNAYRLWKNFNDSNQFLRVQSEFSGSVRTISPHLLVNPETSNVTVLLHNYEQASVVVKLNFDSSWANPEMATETCLYMGSDGIPVFSTNEEITISNGLVKVRPESTCFYTFHTDMSFKPALIYNEVTLYSTDVVMRLDTNSISTQIYVPSKLNIVSVVLRFAVSNADTNAVTKPARVHVTWGDCLDNDFFMSYGVDDPKEKSQWKVYNYNVPTNLLVTGNNTITLDFVQKGGYVSSVVLLVGAMAGHT